MYLLIELEKQELHMIMFEIDFRLVSSRLVSSLIELATDCCFHSQLKDAENSSGEPEETAGKPLYQIP